MTKEIEKLKNNLLILQNLDNDLSKIDHNIPTGGLYNMICELEKEIKEREESYLRLLEQFKNRRIIL